MQTLFHRALATFILGAGAALLSAGCSKTETPPVAPAKSTLPQSGSTFRFERRDLDSTGQTIPGSEGEAAITFLKTDLSFRGRDSVVAVADKNSSEVGYFRYEGTDGIAIFTKLIESYGIPGVWVTLPINGRPPVQTARDTMATILGATVPVTISVSAVPQGTETFGVKAEMLGTLKSEIQVIVRLKSGGAELLRHTHAIWYSPKIGYFTKEDISFIIAPSLGVGGPSRTRTVRELRSYLLE